MDNLQKLQAANPHIQIHTIHEAAFRRYGSVIQEDTSAFCAAAETIPFPETGSKYVASTPELDEIPAAAKLRETHCGGLDEQIGLCWGHSNQLQRSGVAHLQRIQHCRPGAGSAAGEAGRSGRGRPG